MILLYMNKGDIHRCNNYRVSKVKPHYESFGEGGGDEDEEGHVFLRVSLASILGVLDLEVSLPKNSGHDGTYQ